MVNSKSGCAGIAKFDLGEWHYSAYVEELKKCYLLNFNITNPQGTGPGQSIPDSHTSKLISGM